MVLASIFVLALILALLLTPLGTRVAWAVGYLDHPEARKLHTSATALLGGAVVFVSTLIAWVVGHTFLHVPSDPRAFPLLTGAAIALGLGLWDDRFGMNPVLKLFGQAAAAAALISAGLVPHLGLPVVVNAGIALVCLIGLMNAVNFLDNMNGVVGGLSAILLLGFGVASAVDGELGIAAAQLGMAGACGGFLKYNFPRAKIFLGDAGSLFLGYSLGASALLAFERAPQGWGRVGVILMLAYPTFDLLFVVVNRLREGRKIYEGGKDHSNHRLASVIRCQTRTVQLLWLSGAALCASGLVVLKLNQPMPALLVSVPWMLLFLWAGARLSSVPVRPAKPAAR